MAGSLSGPRGIGQKIVDGKKQCSTCQQWKNLNAFTVNEKTFSGWASRCKECRRKIEPMPKYTRIKHVRRTYGIDEETYINMLEACQNGCFICQTPFGIAHDKRPCVDHDHKTGQVRGLICQRCNQAVAKVNDSVEIAYRLYVYLEHFWHE